MPRGKADLFRTVPLNPPAIEALQAQRNKSGNMRYVFPSFKSGRYYKRKMMDLPRSKQAMQDMIRPLAEHVPAFERVRSSRCGRIMHIFRHTYCSMLAQKNVSATKIGRWAGNSTCVQRYIHLAEGYDKDCEF